MLPTAAISDSLTASGAAPWLALSVAIIVHAVCVLLFFGVVPMAAIWLERKISGRIQDRLGPTRVGGKFGWLQGAADGLKAIQKEDIIPAAADAMLFRMAPYFANVAVFGGFMLLPFARDWVAVAADIGLFILLAILSLEVVGIVMAGYASGSKWSLFGGIREAAQMVSYEIPLALCGLVPVLAAGSLNLVVIGEAQRGWFLPNWLIFQNPFAFVAFFVYFTVATAGSKRAPFDLAEAESELVGGFHTEYSTMRWVYFMLAEYGHMFLISGVAVLLFLGGWWTGLPFVDEPVAALRADASVSIDVEGETGRVGEGEQAALVPSSPSRPLAPSGVSNYIGNLIGAVIFCFKATLLVIVQIWIRWTLPRLRIDQVMTTCFKYLVPISCALFLGAVLWPLTLSSTVGRTTLFDWPAAWSEATPLRFAEALTGLGGLGSEVGGRDDEGAGETGETGDRGRRETRHVPRSPASPVPGSLTGATL